MKPEKAALQIFDAALRAADPEEAVLRHVQVENGILMVGRRRYDLSKFEHVFVIGAGKASASMARPIEKLLGKRIKRGSINVKYGHTAKLKRIELNECGHPVPDEAGLEGAERIEAIVRNAGPADLVICLISGGASALLPAPVPPVTLVEKQRTTSLLLECGANIHEMNAVRKHLSRLKGGRLAELAQPATLISLLLSDVIGDDLDTIGSGPTAPDNTTFQTAREVLEKYKLTARIPASVQEVLAGDAETPKPDNPAFSRTQNVIIGSNRQALEAAAAEARTLGYRTLLLSSFLEGETRDVARAHAAIAKEIRVSGNPVKPPCCIVSGGETTVTIHGKGQGGRNQEFALAAAQDIADLPETVVFSAGTDGTDGPTDAAGAWCDGGTIERAANAGLSAKRSLANNDSYAFFDQIGGLVKTGPTGTNVADIHLVIVGKTHRTK